MVGKPCVKTRLNAIHQELMRFGLEIEKQEGYDGLITLT